MAHWWPFLTKKTRHLCRKPRLFWPKNQRYSCRKRPKTSFNVKIVIFLRHPRKTFKTNNYICSHKNSHFQKTYNTLRYGKTFYPPPQLASHFWRSSVTSHCRHWHHLQHASRVPSLSQRSRKYPILSPRLLQARAFLHPPLLSPLCNYHGKHSIN